MKEKNFNLELPLHIPSSAASLLPSMDYHQPRSEAVSKEQQRQRPLTIFYNGQVCICSVNEFQARAILLRARREMEELTMISPSGGSQPPWPPQQQQLFSPSSLSMKRSLEQFLQKRKHRICHTTSSSSTPN